MISARFSRRSSVSSVLQFTSSWPNLADFCRRSASDHTVVSTRTSTWPCSTFAFVIVLRIVLDSAEEVDYLHLLTMGDVLFERRRDRVFLCLVLARLLGLF